MKFNSAFKVLFENELPFEFVNVKEAQGLYPEQYQYFILTDSEGGDWTFIRGVNDKPDESLEFSTMPDHYRKHAQALGFQPSRAAFFSKVEKAAKKAIKKYELSKHISPETKQSFDELIDILS